ncbi:HlyD family secretion protein [Sphingomonas bacterium]|uniref:HlyD family secretion protein n=1 Tax=Sphingomonas bacterium TaxID=1895847 RepID=UPI0015754026|nr:HlyD family secretion protein [Sphingomonas bacterium]
MATDENGKAGANEAGANEAGTGEAGHKEDGAPKADGGDKADGSGGGGADEGDAGDSKPSPLSKPWVRIALAVAAVAALILLVWWIVNYRNYGRYQQSTNDAYLAADQINVAPRVAGYVEQVLVGDNQMVRAGQLLARIDQRTENSTAARSRAQIAQARATVAQARATRTQQFDMIRQARAQADQSRAMLRQNEAADRFNASQVARYAPLSAVGAETDEKLAQNRSMLDQSHAQVASARAQLAASDAQVASARHQIAIDDAQIQSGLAQVAASQAQLAANQVDVDAAAVTSPIGGRVGDRTVRVGQYVQVGTRMMTVVPVDRLYLVANFKETQIGLMRVGQSATVEVDALAGEEIHGVVESFSPGTGSRFAQVPIDNATGNFTKIVQRVAVRIRLDAGPEARRVLVPGLSVSVSVDTRGARRDKVATKDEGDRLEDGRKRQDRHELDADRRQRKPGAGR